MKESEHKISLVPHGPHGQQMIADWELVCSGYEIDAEKLDWNPFETFNPTQLERRIKNMFKLT